MSLAPTYRKQALEQNEEALKESIQYWRNLQREARTAERVARTRSSREFWFQQENYARAQAEALELRREQVDAQQDAQGNIVLVDPTVKGSNVLYTETAVIERGSSRWYWLGLCLVVLCVLTCIVFPIVLILAIWST